MADLLAFVESLDSLPEATREFYTKSDKGFKLNVAPAGGLSLLNSASTAQQVSELNAQIQTLKPFQEKYQALQHFENSGITKDQIEQFKSGTVPKGSISEDDVRNHAMYKTLQDDYDRSQTELISSREMYDNEKISSHVNGVIAKHAKLFIKGSEKVVRDALHAKARLDDDKNIFVTDASGQKPAYKIDESGTAVKQTLEDYVQNDFKKDYGFVFDFSAGQGGVGANGGGNGGAGSGKKWDDYTSAEKTALQQSNPQEYDRLATEALNGDINFTVG